MQQTAKSIRVRNAGVVLLLWPSREPLAFSDSRDRVTRKGTHAVCGQGARLPCASRRRVPCASQDAHGAAGAVKRSSVPHAPSGEEESKKTTAALSRSGRGAMTRVYTPPSCPRRRASSIPERQRSISGALGYRVPAFA